jgi:hypothetical protein
VLKFIDPSAGTWGFGSIGREADEYGGRIASNLLQNEPMDPESSGWLRACGTGMSSTAEDRGVSRQCRDMKQAMEDGPLTERGLPPERLRIVLKRPFIFVGFAAITL